MSEKLPTPVTPWDPFRELDIFRGWPSMRLFGGGRDAGFAAPTPWSPVADMSETDDHFVVTVELAGAKKDDVHVEVGDGVLTIRGEKRSEREEEKEQRRYSERTYGMFSRSFTLPPNAKQDDVQASFEDGVLSVRIAKSEERKPKTIQVR